MRAPIQPRQKGVRFDITPLIDVVFLLVIFFLVTSHFAANEPGEAVSLPAAGQTSEDRLARRLVITIPKDGSYLVGGRPVNIEQIEALIAEGAGDAPQTYAVEIRGDREAASQVVKPIMLACARHGITKFGFAVVQRE